MKAIQFNATIPRYLLAKSAGRLYTPLLWGGLSSTYLREVEPPKLPGEAWLGIRTRYGGICGSDMNMVLSQASPYYDPLISMPLTLGHENVGQIAAMGREVRSGRIGDRIVVEPLLWCQPRGFKDPCSSCAKGEINRCTRFTVGQISPGMYTGTCSTTGGSWSPYFVAHESQIYPIPDEVSDENALLIEPLACCLHAVLHKIPSDDERVLIIGSGTIGLLTLAALRIMGCQAEVMVLAKYPFQAENATRLGADRAIVTGDVFSQVASHYEARVFAPRIGRRIMIGGPDVIYDCAGSDRSIDDAMRMARGGGRVVLLGLLGIARGIDWSSLFSQELVVHGSFLYQRAENYNGNKISTFDLAIDLLKNHSLDLSWIITHKFDISDYKLAFEHITRKGETNIIKAVFEFSDGF
jgi:threonine dehydrogenase-like Zn-dependent dehydrogenase